jgi:predicted secreted hydrolase
MPYRTVMPRWMLAYLLAGSMFLAGCSPHDGVAPRDGGGTVSVTEGMAGEPDPGFARALEPRRFEFPRDHAAHPAYATEWWYFTGNLADPDGRPFGYQLTLFRVGLTPGEPPDDSDWRAHQIYMGHLAVSDLQARRHYATERFSRAAAGLAGSQASPFKIWLGPWRIAAASPADGVFPLRVSAADTDLGIDLVIERGERPMVLQGDQGLSRKGAAEGNASYYYSMTRLPTSGTVTAGGQSFRVAGDSWFDREWSSSALADDQEGWDWFALHLDDGHDLMFYRMRGRDGSAQRFSKGVLLRPDGTRRPLALDDVILEPRRHWKASNGVVYPVTWRLAIPDLGLDLAVEAAFDDQEMALTVRYWEGAVRVAGTHTGVGYLEMSGYAR